MVVVLALAAVAWSACGDGGTDNTPSRPPDQPSARASLDRAVAAVGNGDLNAVIDQLVFTQQACAPATGGLGGPPECGPGEVPGTVVGVVLFASCEGYWVRESQAERTLARFVEGKIELHGAYATNARGFEDAQYIAIFGAEREGGRHAQALYVSAAGIVGVDYGCGQSPQQMVEQNQLTDPIILPAEARTA
jgi:hypothetical protein